MSAEIKKCNNCDKKSLAAQSQDKLHGKDMRVMNSDTKNTFTCTVCGAKVKQVLISMLIGATAMAAAKKPMPFKKGNNKGKGKKIVCQFADNFFVTRKATFRLVGCLFYF